MRSLRTDLRHCQDAVISRGVPDLSTWMFFASVRFSAFRQGISYRDFVRKVLTILERGYSQTRHIVVKVYFPEYLTILNRVVDAMLTKEP